MYSALRWSFVYNSQHREPADTAIDLVEEIMLKEKPIMLFFYACKN